MVIFDVKSIEKLYVLELNLSKYCQNTVYFFSVTMMRKQFYSHYYLVERRVGYPGINCCGALYSQLVTVCHNFCCCYVFALGTA